MVKQNNLDLEKSLCWRQRLAHWGRRLKILISSTCLLRTWVQPSLVEALNWWTWKTKKHCTRCAFYKEIFVVCNFHPHANKLLCQRKKKMFLTSRLKAFREVDVCMSSFEQITLLPFPLPASGVDSCSSIPASQGLGIAYHLMLPLGVILSYIIIKCWQTLPRRPFRLSTNISNSLKDCFLVQKVDWRQIQQWTGVELHSFKYPLRETSKRFKQLPGLKQVTRMELERGSICSGIFAWLSLENNYWCRSTRWATRAGQSQSGSEM